MFQDISPIQDFTGNLMLGVYRLQLGEPKYSVDESKERDVLMQHRCGLKSG